MKEIDKGHYKILIEKKKNTYNVYIHNKYFNLTELYDENLTKEKMEIAVNEIKGGN